MESLLILYNNQAGAQEKEAPADQLTQTCLERGMSARNISVLCPDSPDQAFTCAKEASQKGIDCIAAIGGDGTINPIAGGIYAGGSRTKLGILPAGSVNNLAKALNIPLQLPQAIQTICQGRPRAIDICQVNDRFMVSSLVLGAPADLAAGVTSADKRKYGKLAFVKDSLGQLPHTPSYPVELRYNGQRQQIKTRFLLLAMTNSIGGLPIPNPDIQPDDGFLDGCYTDSSQPWLTEAIRSGDFSSLLHLNHFQTDALIIESRSEDAIPQARIDEDPAASLPLTLTVLPKAIQVIVPED